MAENIELHSYSPRKTESDSEEYHEIDQESPNALMGESPQKHVNDFDFFTKFNVQETMTKKKRIRKKKKTRSIMDIINSEIASEPLIQENMIFFLDQKASGYLINSSNQVLKPRVTCLEESEKGWNNCIKIAKINPTFPRVLENTVRKYTSINTNYVEPIMLSEIISEYPNKDYTQSPKFLDIMIENLKFDIHHTFSFEKLLCVKLIEIYAKYETIIKNINDYHKAIIVNRKTSEDVKSKLISINPNKKYDIQFDSTVLKYTKNMLNIKEKYFQAHEEKRIITHQLVSLWEDIKMLREKKGTTTAYTLVVTERELDQDEFEKKWTKVYEEEFTDILIRIEYDFIQSYIQYKEAKHSLEKNERNKYTRPELKINDDELKEQVGNLVSRMISKHVIDLTLKEDVKLLKKIRTNNNQQNIPHYLFKFFIDNVFVCESEIFVSNDLKEIMFSESFCIQILSNNSILKIALFENSDEVSVLNFNLSDIKKDFAESNKAVMNFIYNDPIQPTADVIGNRCNIKDISLASKVRIKSSHLFKGKILTTCVVNYKVGWNNKLSPSDNKNVKDLFELKAHINRLLNGTQIPSVSILSELINKIYDKNINENPELLSAISRVDNSKIKTYEAWVIDDRAQDLIRFKLLNFRNKGKLVHLENQAISLQGNQISTEQIDYLKSKDTDASVFSNFDEYDEINSIDLQRYLGVKYVIKLNNNLMTKADEFLLKKSYKDVVNDYQLLRLRNLLMNQMSLSDTQSITKQQLLRDSLKAKHGIRVTVIKAYNLFDKTTNMLNEEEQSHENIAGFKVRPLRPFVRVSYHRESAQTPTAIGCYPTWNHTVVLKTKLEPISSVHINIYDECRINISNPDEPTNNTVIYRKYNMWLGAVHIPLRTVLESGTLRGTFKINSPPFSFGYENLAFTDGDSHDPGVSRLIKKNTSLITLIITTDISHLSGHTYNVPVQPVAQEDLVLKHLNMFVADYSNNFPTRNITLTAIDISGCNKCVIEFLQPLPLPDLEYFPKDPKKVESALSKSSGLSKSSSSHSSRKNIKEEKESPTRLEDWRKDDKQNKLIEFTLRYVSLIPTYELTESHVVSLMGVELLKLLYGSPFDHTILLASYFTYLELKCYVIMGFGLPRGLSSYVLMRYPESGQSKRGFWEKNDQRKWYVYDAVAGEKYELREAGCPLKTVSFVFNCENIWVNVQSSTECENISFDFSKSSDWQIVFNKPIFLTKPVVNDGLYIKSNDIESLRDSLEDKIKTKVQKWRPRVKTIWNRYCSNLLRETLPHWEYWAFNPLQRPSPGHRLKQMMLTYMMFGFPLNMPYLNAKLITSSLKYAGVHTNDDPNVEFGLAVEVFTYPNNVLSIWVYLASLIKIGD